MPWKTSLTSERVYGVEARTSETLIWFPLHILDWPDRFVVRMHSVARISKVRTDIRMTPEVETLISGSWKNKL